MLKRFFLMITLVAVLFSGGYSADIGTLPGTSNSASTAPPADAELLEVDEDFDSNFNGDFDDWDAPAKLISDPFESINRGVFWINDKLYFYLFKPVARGYRAIVPRPARVSVGNFFHNAATPIRVGNAILQLKFTNAGTESYRFIVNSTIGLAGLFDPALSLAGVRRVPADFGQTLGTYGFGHGFYLVLPIVGPSSLRDGTGSFVDSFADPFRYAGLATEDVLLMRVADSTNRLSLDRDTYEGIIRDSLDPYLFIRTAYAQRRLAQIGEPVYNLNILEAPVFDGDLFNPMQWFRMQQ